MEYRQLGRTGLTVSAIGCGTWELGGREWGEIGTEDALAVLRHAHDQGVTFFDTADQYGGGRSERLLGTDARMPSQAALRFCLAHPAVSSVVPGMMSVEQAADGVAALAAPPLSAAELERVRAIRSTWE